MGGVEEEEDVGDAEGDGGGEEEAMPTTATRSMLNGS